MIEIRRRVATLPDNTAVLYTAIFVDGAGVVYTPQSALLAVAEATNRPIVIDVESQLGYGGAGGFIESLDSRAQESARLAVRILDGESASQIPVAKVNVTRPIFDWRQLQRWGISEARLPPDSDIRFREFSLWEQYRWRMIAILAVILVQAALITRFLFERHARKRAQDEVERALGFEQSLVDISASLLRGPLRNVDDTIRNALRAIGEFLGLERIVLWRLRSGGEYLEPTHAWIANCLTAPPALVTKGQLPSIFRHIARGDIVSLPNIEEMPAEAGGDKQVLRELGIRSLLMVPVAVEAVTVGAISLATVGTARVWPDALIPRVRLIGEVFASLLARRRAAEQVGEARIETGEYRERLAHLIRVHTAGEMFASIAHEINQPLVAIKNYALAARRRATGSTGDAAKVEELIDKIGAQAMSFNPCEPWWKSTNSR